MHGGCVGIEAITSPSSLGETGLRDWMGFYISLVLVAPTMLAVLANNPLALFPYAQMHVP